jgi:hypothetical protein
MTLAHAIFGRLLPYGYRRQTWVDHALISERMRLEEELEPEIMWRVLAYVTKGEKLQSLLPFALNASGCRIGTFSLQAP